MSEKNGAIKIDNGIPITRTKREAKYPFAEMEIGDSFGTDKVSCSSFHYWAHKTGFKFKRRTQPDGTVRVWRVA